MNYINLTARQARYFNEHGHILIPTKIEPQPTEFCGGMPLKWAIEDKITKRVRIESPYRAGEVYGFKEPWFQKHGEIVYVADYKPEAKIESESNYWLMPEWAMRLFGKYVKSEVRKLENVLDEDLAVMRETLDMGKFTWEVNLFDWCFFSLFEKCEKGGV